MYILWNVALSNFHYKYMKKPFSLWVPIKIYIPPSNYPFSFLLCKSKLPQIFLLLPLNSTEDMLPNTFTNSNTTKLGETWRSLIPPCRLDPKDFPSYQKQAFF